MQTTTWRAFLALLFLLCLPFNLAFAGKVTASLSSPSGSPARPPARIDGGSLVKIEPVLLREMVSKGQADAFIWLREKADLSPASALPDKAARGRFVLQTLQAVADRSQAGLRRHLEGQQADYQPFYVANKILVRDSDVDLLQILAARPDVERITANHIFQLAPELQGKAPSIAQRPASIEPNLEFIRADLVWELGFTGQGVVLAANDTGMEETHPAIARHYRGCIDPPDCTLWDHNYNWWDATGEFPDNPSDPFGHGTFINGVLVGDDGNGNQVGVAPGAQVVHCKPMINGGGEEGDFVECFQWDLAPWDLDGLNPDPSKAPDAVVNSWGWWGGGEPTFEDEIAALQAAGVLVHAAPGGEGPGCGTLRSPADYAQVLTVGSAAWEGEELPGRMSMFSARGPSSLYPQDYFPDVLAPGENIRSSVPPDDYEYWSGTSFSGPHAVGVAALMWSANPSLRGLVTDTVRIILDTAVPLTGQKGSNCGGDYVEGPNNDWGHGTIDALAAVEEARLFGQFGTLQGTVTDLVSSLPISNTTLSAALQPGIAWDTTSASDGTYALLVMSGTYTVTAAAAGYLDSSIAGVQVISGSVITQNIQLAPLSAFHMTLLPAVGIGYGDRGRSLTFNLSLENTGDLPDQYDLFSSASGWEVDLSFDSADLEPGGATSLTVEVQLPASAEPGETGLITVTARSHSNPAVEASSTLVSGIHWNGYLPVSFKGKNP